MRRRLFTLLAAVSLLVCLATAGLWVRSYYIRDVISFGRDGGSSHLAQSIAGRIHILSNLSGGRDGGETTWTADRLVPRPLWNGGMSSYPATVEWHGPFVWQTYTRADVFMSFGGFPPNPVTQHRLIVLPYWAIVVAFAMLPVTWIGRRLLKRRLTRVGHCPRCGYDLRASPDRCPECGELKAGDRSGGGQEKCG